MAVRNDLDGFRGGRLRVTVEGTDVLAGSQDLR